ncbi:phosphotransferase family protein [Streptomyces roseirectus]|uniref:phosphotransferase family protein n=1 Tax=Streptomyces roseirectus TaxID=2768066 RepID=UPI003CCCC7CB
MCHHDLGPNNTVFRDEMPAAFIDFDLAAPGSPLEDVGCLQVMIAGCRLRAPVSGWNGAPCSPGRAQ